MLEFRKLEADNMTFDILFFTLCSNYYWYFDAVELAAPRRVLLTTLQSDRRPFST